MRIRELTLVGFKSFAERATLRFSTGVNAVIGPNGCGKTNVLDALRWVLGEQSFTTLRCAKNEDLIFGGTALVPATNYAEVKLVLEDGSQPAADSSQPSEIEIGRRYYRSGESEYSLNRQACRLRDIQDIFLGSGTGTKAYSLFDLRQMREIISGNVRRLFEEAASLAKYQEAKAECLRKLSLTEGDLLRLDDIIAERERVVRSLARQAGRLRASERLRAEEKGLLLVELRAEYEAVKRDVAGARRDSESLEQATAARLSEIHRLEEELAVRRKGMADFRLQVANCRARRDERRKVLDDLTGRNLLDGQRVEMLGAAADTALGERSALLLRIAEHEEVFGKSLERLSQAAGARTRAQERLEQVRTEREQVEARLSSLREHETTLSRQVAELAEERYRLQQEQARAEAAAENQAETETRLEKEIADCEGRRAEGGRRGAELSSKRDAARSAAESGHAARAELEQEMKRVEEETARCKVQSADCQMKLAEMEKELAVLAASLNQEQGDAARKLLGDELRGEVSEFLDIEPGWEQAVGAALSPVIDFLVAGQLPAAAAAGLQQSRPDLRFGFIVPSEQETAALMGPADGAIAGRLAARVKVKPGAPRLLEQMVEGCLVAESVDALPRLGERYRQWVFVTREGVARFPDGRVVVESRERNRLSIGRRAENVELQIADCRLQIERSEADGSRLAAERSGLEERLGRALVELGDAERERAALEATFDAAAAVRDELERDWERLRQERESVQSARRQSAERQARAEAGLAELVERMAAAEGALAQARAQAGESEQQVRNLLDVSAAALGEASEAGQVVSRLEAENAFAKRQIDEGRFRAGSLAQRADAARREVEQLETGMAGRRTEIEQAKLALEQAEEELARLAAGELGQAEEELEANIRELRHAQEQAQTLLLEQRLRLREMEQQCARIVEQARTDHGTDIETYEPPPLEETAQRLSHIRHRLAELGPVNPLAGEEFARERGDLERLRSQRQDVAQAKANLEQTLSEIDQHAQGQFIATYGQVRGHFRDIFRELFLEGEADLVLVNDANPLESEIAITARPRGKNPKRLEQLSDGEKALLAVSLLFAFYRVKPAPFCFLDEVDAPLDDANVGRFADYLRRLADTTQVIIITHNRLTVERADIVFGVTAEQPGVSKLVSVSLEEYRTRAEGGTNDARSTASNAAVPA